MTKEAIINYLTSHKKEFAQKYNIEKIGLFGSYVRDEAMENSILLSMLEEILFSVELIKKTV